MLSSSSSYCRHHHSISTTRYVTRHDTALLVAAMAFRPYDIRPRTICRLLRGCFSVTLSNMRHMASLDWAKCNPQPTLRINHISYSTLRQGILRLPRLQRLGWRARVRKNVDDEQYRHRDPALNKSYSALTIEMDSSGSLCGSENSLYAPKLGSTPTVVRKSCWILQMLP